MPWAGINAFLAEIGSAATEEEFVRGVIKGIERLIPIDIYGVFAVIDPAGQIVPEKTILGDKRWLEPFNERYWQLMPEIGGGDAPVKSIDWRCFRNTEYVTDFLMPQNVRYSIGLTNLGRTRGSSTTFALNRSKRSPAFNDGELAILKILHPHLENYLNFHARLEAAKPSFPDAEELAAVFHSLTRREAEIAALLCQKHGTAMIGARLRISRKTVYKHIQHVFAKVGVTSREELLARIERISRRPERS